MVVFHVCFFELQLNVNRGLMILQLKFGATRDLEDHHTMSEKRSSEMESNHSCWESWDENQSLLTGGTMELMGY